MQLFATKYGHLRITEEQWRKLLLSNEGLFRRIGSPPRNIPGPCMTPSGEVVGNVLSMERIAFQDFATREQQAFLRELEQTDQYAGVEYILAVTNTLQLWKDDIKVLQQIESYLDAEERELEKAIAKLEAEEQDMTALGQIYETLRRRLPDILKDISLDGLDLRTTIKAIRELHERIAEPRRNVKIYLAKVRENMPFLLEP